MSIERTSQIQLAGVEVSLRGSTMADVLEGLAANPNISAGRLVALRSAVRTYCRAQAKDPAAVSADPRAVREVLSHLTPGTLGIGRQSFLNLRSLMGKALDAAGINTVPVRCRTPLAPAWERLMDRVDDRRMRCALLRPLTLLSAAGVQPEDIDQNVVDALARAIEERQILRRPRQANRAFVRAWNRARMSISGWPDVELRIDDRRDRYVLPPESFPPGLRADIADWLRSISTFSLSRRRPPLRPRTVNGHRALLWELASAAAHAGVPIVVLFSLRALIDATVVEPALNWLASRFGGQPAPHLANITRVACTVARHFLDQATEVERAKEERNLRDLRLFCTNLQPRGNGMTRKNRELLNRFKDPELLARFVMLPEQLFARIASKPRLRPADARRAVLAIAIEILLHAPIRIQNLHAVRLDTHYKVYGQGVKARAVLEFAAAEVKNEVDLSYPLPASTAAMIDEFCQRLRPLLAEPNSPFLFPGRGPRPGASSALSKKIADVTAEFVGVRITAHQFRHVCALLYLQRHPGDYETVRRFLGHSRIETTIRYYAGMEGEAAIALWDNTLTDIRKNAVERLRARQRRRRR